MESEQIQRDPFPRATHRTPEAGDLASARKYHDVTESFIMSQVPGSQEVKEKEDPSLSHDLALLFVMKEHMWDGTSNPAEKDTSKEPERRPRGLKNWEEFSDGKQNLDGGESGSTNSMEHSLNSSDGEFAGPPSTSSQSFLLDTASPALPYPSKDSAGKMESQVGDSFGQPPHLGDTWHEESATTDTLPDEEDFVNESPLMIRNISDGRKSADFSRPAREHSRELETQRGENRSPYEETDVAMWINKISSKREEESERLINPSSEEEELNLDRAQGKEDHVSSQVSSKEAEECSDVDDEVGDLEENVHNILVLQVQEEEESNSGVGNSPLLKKNVQTSDNISDCGDSESDQNRLSTRRKPELAESEALELASGEEEGRKGLNEKAAESETGADREEAQWSHNDRGEQERTVQATIDSAPIRSGQDTPDSLGNSLALSGLSDSSSEGLDLSLKEVSSADPSPTSGCSSSEPCVQTTTIPFLGVAPTDFQPVSGLNHSSGQVEHSNVSEEANKMCHCDQDGTQPMADVRKEDVGKEESARSTDGEQITQSFTDVALANDSQDLHGSQAMGSSSDTEENPVPSLRTIITALLQEDPIKGAVDETVTCAGGGSALHSSSQVDRVTGDEASVPDSDGDAHLPALGEDLLEDPQGSTPKALPNPSLEEGLSNIAKEMVKLSLSSWGSVQDTTEHDVKKSHRQPKPTINNATMSRKEAATGTHCTEQDILTSESPCFSILGKERTECDCNADSLPSYRSLCAMATDAAQLTQPLAPALVEDSEQTVPLDLVSLLPSRQPLRFVTLPPTANCIAQPTPPGLHPDQLSEQLSSSSQVNPKSSANETVLEHSSVVPETRSPEQLSTSGSDLNQGCQAPHSVGNSKQPVPMSHRASLPILSRCSVFPSLSCNAASLRTNSKQIAQSVAAGLGHNFQTQSLHIGVSRGSRRSQSDSNSGKHLLVRNSPSTQQRTEASESNSLASRTGSNEPTHPSPPVGRHACWDSSSISKRGDLVLVSSLDTRTEEFSGLPLATCPELDLSLSDLRGEFLGNGATGADSFINVPETTSKFEDTPDGRSSRYTFHPSGVREKPTNARQPPPLLAFTNPIHFLQLGPPSPPSFPYPGVHQDLQWPEQEARNPNDPTASFSEGSGRSMKVLEKSVEESACPAIHRKGLEGRHPRLEKSSSCPDKNTIGLGTKESSCGTKKQETATKQRAKSKDWNRQRFKKTLMPMDGAVGEHFV